MSMQKPLDLKLTSICIVEAFPHQVNQDRPMNFLAPDIAKVALIGIVATIVMDVWLLLLQRLGVPTLDFALIGRWVGHWRHGVFRHAAISKAAPVPGEAALGWLVHYTTGVAFSALLVGACGTQWMHSPSLLPALAVGLVTVAAPWLLMQPAMGAGIASSRTAAPSRNRARSLANHAVFVLGLYIDTPLLALLDR
jgi:hypothetical protein